MKKLWAFVTGILVSLSAQAADIAVSPLLIDLSATANESVPFEFNIAGKDRAKVRLSVYDLAQMETGHMGFIEANADDKLSKINWITLEKSTLEIRKDSNQAVRGEVKLPRKSNGNYLAAVMVEEIKEGDRKNGINLNVRYAVILNINATSKKSRPRIKTEFKALELVRVDDRLMLVGDFTNRSNKDGFLLSEVHIRDNNRKLVEKVRLMTESAWQRQDPASRVFPESRVKVFGFVGSDLSEGTYEFKVRNRFSDRSQPTYKVKLDYNDSIRQIIRATATES